MAVTRTKRATSRRSRQDLSARILSRSEARLGSPTSVRKRSTRLSTDAYSRRSTPQASWTPFSSSSTCLAAVMVPEAAMVHSAIQPYPQERQELIGVHRLRYVIRGPRLQALL